MFCTKGRVMNKLEDIRERLELTTEGPWRAYMAPCCHDMGGVSTPKGYHICEATLGKYGHPMELLDAEFCAAAHEYMPWFIDLLERAKVIMSDSINRAASKERDEAILEWIRDLQEEE